MLKRVFDIISSLTVLIIISPILILISILIIIDSKGHVFYSQKRVGIKAKEFKLYKFRTMKPNSELKGLLTIGNDSRITRLGYYLRKTKLDELPQLFNIILGDMSVVGPRPETPNYVKLYTEEQQKVLKVRPGLTDYASLKFINESEILAKHENPEKAYIEIIMPEKLSLNLDYIRDQSFFLDLKIIIRTVFRILT
jgi:lipopolysaccharide/colanic/teichoic acid biosynthesis glycosyltransferase